MYGLVALLSIGVLTVAWRVFQGERGERERRRSPLPPLFHAPTLPFSLSRPTSSSCPLRSTPNITPSSCPLDCSTLCMLALAARWGPRWRGRLAAQIVVAMLPAVLF